MANNIPAQYIHERPELDTIVGTESIPLSTGQAGSKRTTITKLKDFILAGISLIHNNLGGLNDGQFQHLTVSEKEAALAVPNHNDTANLNVGDYQHFTAAEKANFDAAKVTTVGTGGDYATISAAITAGKKNKFLLISNITEIANISFAASIYDIDLNGFTITLSTFNIVSVANSYSIFRNGTLTATNSIFSCPTAQNCYYYFQNMVLTAGSTMFLNSIHNINAEKTTFNFANIALSMVTDGLFLASAIFNNCVFNGGGATCSTILSGIVGTSNAYSITNCVTIGTFNAIALYNANSFKLKSGTVAKIQMYNTSGLPGVLNNVVFTSSILDFLDVGLSSFQSVVNSKFSSLTVGFTNYANVYFDNVEFLSTSKQTLSMSNLTSGSLLFNSDVDISGDNNIVSILRIQTTAGAKLTLLAGADNNTISVLHTKAATVNSGANNTILIEKIV